MEYVEVRQIFTKELLDDLASKFKISSAVDVGCGVGYFSKFLHDFGFRVTGIDGREGNVEESRRRYPDITFLSANAEDLHPEELGSFDLVLCFGLLYHLENPFRVIRNLYSIAQQVLLVESMCAPGTSPVLELLDEYKGVNQGLNHVAFYPTESCLVKMLYRAGFPFVYGFAKLPAHDMFRATLRFSKQRTILLASRSSVSSSKVHLIPEPVRPWNIWTTRYQRIMDGALRMIHGVRRRLVSSSNQVLKRG